MDDSLGLDNSDTDKHVCTNSGASQGIMNCSSFGVSSLKEEGHPTSVVGGECPWVTEEAEGMIDTESI